MSSRRGIAAKSKRPPIAKAGTRQRLKPADRESMIVAGAVRFFAEVGFEGQTRELARRLGITQPLLYRYFPSKSALIERVYREFFVTRLDPQSEAELIDRSIPLRARLTRFYLAYARRTLTYEWVRIYMFSGLKGVGLNPRYQKLLRERVFTPVIREIRAELGLPQPPERPLTDAEFEHVYALHASIFYLGVRKWIYGMDPPEELEHGVANRVAAFLDGVPKIIAAK
ncbi:MAG TPA: helix-turn-helix domain-containing protein [Alphaproteobacteria bacterium]|nr:helix-turn-helix domain-containing protein [Alphaproteobacteria bacterium]